ncbi:ABC transporter permease [Candidatus Saccharibacteria bacterium]|nr:ABC transporter permease [Candidatus Saccharibacteria bacterium]
MRNILTTQNRDLLRELVKTDFKLRYQGSALGYVWSLLRPLLLFLILYVVFVRFLRVGDGVPHFPIYLLLGIVLWSFFAEMTSQSLTAITSRGDMIKKVRIKKWIIILSSSISALISLMLNLVVVTVFMVINRVELTFNVLYFPLILIETYILALGISLILAAAYVKYRDISYVWEVILQADFYATPILYPLTLIANPFYQKLVMINPMAQAIQDARYALVTQDTVTLSKLVSNDLIVIMPAVLSIVLLVLGIVFFRKQSSNFAENL